MKAVYIPTLVEPQLLFKSSFGGNTAIAAFSSVNLTNGTGYQNITGNDLGYDFPIEPFGSATTSSFHHVTNSPPAAPYDDMANYFLTEVVSAQGRPHVIHQSLLKIDDQLTQTHYEINYTTTPMTAIADNDLYVKYKLFLPADLFSDMPDDSWRAFMHLKSGAVNDYRVELYINHLESQRAGALYFETVVDDPADSNNQLFLERYTDFDVPLGEWMDVEFFHHRSKNGNGRFVLAINGTKLTDWTGDSNYGSLNNHMNRLNIFGIYQKSTVTYPAEQWVDDVEVWNAIPSTASFT